MATKPPKAPKGAKTDDGDLTKLLKFAQKATRPKTLDFGIAATGPREGQLVLMKRGKLKRSELQDFMAEYAKWEFESEKQKNPKAKETKKDPDVAVGRCKAMPIGGSTLLLTSRGKFPQKCKRCIEYLVTRKYKAAQFSSVEFEEQDSEGPDISDADAYRDALEQLRKELALAQSGERLPEQRIAELANQLKQAEQLIASSAFAQADDLLDSVEETLDSVSSATSETQTVSTPDPPDDAAYQSFFTDWLNGIVAQLNLLKQGSSADLPEILNHVKSVRDAVARQDWKAATGNYQTVDRMLTVAVRVLRDTAASTAPLPPPRPPSPPPKAPPEPVAQPPVSREVTADPELLQGWEARQNELKQELKSVLVKDPTAVDSETKKRLASLLEKSDQLARKQHDYRQAGMAQGAVSRILNDVRQRLNPDEAPLSKEAAEARDTISTAAVSSKAGVVAFAKLRLKLKAAVSARDTAAGNLRTACMAMLSTPDFIGDPQAEAPETLKAVSEIGQRVPPIAEMAAEIDDALDRMATTANSGGRERAKQEALKSLAAYRRQLDSEPLLKDMQSTEAGSFPIYDGLVGAVDELASAITG